jgi:hypothetical protein
LVQGDEGRKPRGKIRGTLISQLLCVLNRVYFILYYSGIGVHCKRFVCKQKHCKNNKCDRSESKVRRCTPRRAQSRKLITLDLLGAMHGTEGSKVRPSPLPDTTVVVSILREFKLLRTFCY